MGAKRRENYDDWWRCEINFEPTLDELFGITNAKQGIKPRADLLTALECDLEPIARALNGRARQRFELVKATKPLTDAERQAARAEPALPALPRRRESLPEDLRRLVMSHGDGREPSSPYQIVATELPTTAAFEIARRRDQLVLVFNTLAAAAARPTASTTQLTRLSPRSSRRMRSAQPRSRNQSASIIDPSSFQTVWDRNLRKP